MRPLSLILIMCGLLMINCPDNRPRFKEANKVFTELYSGVEVVKIHNTYQDWDCVGYTFTYKKPGFADEKDIYLQWIQNPKTKVWELNPEPPQKLP